MNQSSDNIRKRYAYHPKDRSKHTCIINGPGNLSDECKVLGDFGYKYYKNRPTKDSGHETATKEKFNRQQENNAIVNHVVYGKVLKKKNVSAEAEAYENIDYEIYNNNLYQIDIISLDYNK